MPAPRRFALVLLPLAIASLASGAAIGETSPHTNAPDLLVRLRSNPGSNASAALVRAGGTLVAKELSLWKLPASSAAKTVRALRASRSVAFSEPERRYAASVSALTLSDPLVPHEWWRAAIGVDQLTPPGPGVPVSVVDSGVDVEHPELAGRPNLALLNPQEPQPLGGVHGTAVASVVGAQENGVGIVGIYPDAILRSWDAATGLGTELTSSGIVNGILSASVAGRSVINLSLGGPGRDPAIEAAVNLAVARGSLVVAASGNDGDRGNALGYPAAYPHVLTVGATQPDGSVAPFSSTSRFVDLAAPGVEIPVAAVDPETGATGWALEDGTSFASPLVAGAAAWVWTARSALSADQVAQILRASATDIGAPGRDPASGFGLLNVPAALARPAPVMDQAEPNDDVAQVTPGRIGYHGTLALTRRTKTSNRTSGRVDAAEDPRDVYRVWLPKGKFLAARASADAAVSVTLARAGARSVASGVARTDRLVRGASTSAGASLAYRNPGKGRGRFVLVVVTPETAKITTYTLSVTAR